MIRVISIVLIAVIALQTVGCTAWRQVARTNEFPEAKREASMRDEFLGELKEGMAVRIGIREGTLALVQGEVIEGTIETVGHISLTVILGLDRFRSSSNQAKERLTVPFSDIASIEYRRADLQGNIALAVVTTVIMIWARAMGVSK